MRVVEIGLNGFLCTNEEGQSAHSNTSVNWDGEPLTEEWLIKFGFEDTTKKLYHPAPNHKAFEFNHVHIKVYNDRQHGNKTWYYDQVLIDAKIEHVHQLQNLYFALTGSELTIKE